MRALAIGALAVLTAAAAAIALNVVLLGYSSSGTERVGKLSPAAGAPQFAPPPPPRTTTVVVPLGRREHSRERVDD